MWHYGIWVHSPLTSVGVVHSTWPSWVMWHMHAPTFNKWVKKKKKKNEDKKVTLHINTRGAMRGCGLTSLVFCINDKIRDVGERNLTIRSDIWTTNICSLGFRDIREWLISWTLILQSLRYIASWSSRLWEICQSSREIYETYLNWIRKSERYQHVTGWTVKH